MVIAGLFGGIIAGVAGVVLALAAGFGVIGAVVVYVLAGMCGVIVTAVAVALCPNRHAQDDQDRAARVLLHP